MLVALGLVLGVASVACGDDGDDEPSPEEIAAVEEVLNQVLSAGPEQADYFFEHTTDNLIETALFSNREDCQANVEECLGEPLPPGELSGTTIDGDTATAMFTVEFGTFELHLVNEDDVWKVDIFQAASDEAPEGAASVDIGLREFAFDFEEGDIPDDGNFVFNASNTGGQPHEIVLLPIAAEGSLEEAMGGLGDDVQPAGLKIFVQPGQEDITMAFASPLAAGRYAVVCNFPDITDPEMTPHSEKGMLAEFTIGGDGEPADGDETPADEPTEEDAATE
jgi:hypothetical protein